MVPNGTYDLILYELLLATYHGRIGRLCCENSRVTCKLVRTLINIEIIVLFVTFMHREMLYCLLKEVFVHFGTKKWIQLYIIVLRKLK